MNIKKRKVKQDESFNQESCKRNANYQVLRDEHTGDRIAKIYQKSEQDPFWYAFDDKAISNMANVPWSEIVGSSVLESGAASDVAPALLTLDYIPTIGCFPEDDNYSDSAIDRVATSLFGDYVRGWSSGVSFEAPDLVMSFLAGASLKAFLEIGRRAYGAHTVFVLENKTYGSTLVEALGFDYADLVGNAANFRSRFNQAVQKFNRTVPVPNGYTISQRWDWINTFMFTDTSSPTYSTLMCYKMKKVLKYSPLSTTTGTCLKYVNISDGMSVDDYFNIIDSLFDALNDDDVRSMFSSIKQAAPESEMMKVAELEEKYAVPVVRNDIIAATIHNARFLYPSVGVSAGGYLPAERSTNGQTAYDVALYQTEDGKLVSHPCATAAVNSEEYNQYIRDYFNEQLNQSEMYIDSYDTLTDAKYLLDFTANISYPYDTFTIGSGSNAVPMITIMCRSEIIDAVTVHTYGTTLFPYNEFNFSGEPMPPAIDISNADPTEFLKLVWLSHIDSHPLVSAMRKSGEVYITLGRFGEIDKYTFISKRALRNIHRNSFWRLINLP